MSATIAIAGRPNVGKSTLFNRLVGKSMALVSGEPGVTRDWREGEGRLFDLKFRVLDTAGLEDMRSKGSLAARTAERTEAALAQTNAVLFLVDARAGLTADDKAIAREIRKSGKPIILVANKCEGTYLPDGFEEFEALGFGEAIAVSAGHGEGLMELYAALKAYIEPSAEDEGAALNAEEKDLHVAVVGRPNVGKSTLINRLIGEERMLTGPEPGLTRDAIPIGWEYQGRPVRLVDTAGLRKKARVTEKLEKMSTHESMRAVRLAHVVVLVIDAAQPFDKQDLVIARHVAEEGRALVVAVNKWDSVKEKRAITRLVAEKAEVSLAQLAGVPLVPVSALKGDGLDDLMKAVMRVYGIWNMRISTGKLNRWLERMEDEHPPPIVSGRRLKLRYMTQIKSRPPTFQLWVNKPVDLPESYTRFLTNGLRSFFKLEAVPIRWQMRKGENPYDEKKRK
jgi:GTP-binding protein